MRKLPIDLSAFAEAMTMFDNLSEAAAYLNLKTGEILYRFDPEFSGNDDDINYEEQPDKFLYIPPLNSHDGFRIMESFVDSLKEGEAKKALTRDLSRPRPFRNFKDTLNEFLDLRENYFAHHENETQKIAQNFLEAQEIQISPS